MAEKNWKDIGTVPIVSGMWMMPTDSPLPTAQELKSGALDKYKVTVANLETKPTPSLPWLTPEDIPHILSAAAQRYVSDEVLMKAHYPQEIVKLVRHGVALDLTHYIRDVFDLDIEDLDDIHIEKSYNPAALADQYRAQWRPLARALVVAKGVGVTFSYPESRGVPGFVNKSDFTYVGDDGRERLVVADYYDPAEKLWLCRLSNEALAN